MKIRLIKKYNNRKLYDTETGGYVTLAQVAQIIRDGYDIKVIENSTKNDITYAIQLQVLFDQERRSRELQDTNKLNHFIRFGGLR